MSKNRKENIKLSIVIANYNQGDFIKESIQSVINQSYSNWELIIIDDGSIDDSIKKIKPFLKEKRIRLIINKKHNGCGFAKRIGADKSTGELIAILDADDTLSIDALEIVVSTYLNHNKPSLMYSTHYECDNNLNIISKVDWVEKINKYSSNLHIPRVSALRVFKKQTYNKTNGYNKKLKSAVDKDIIYKLEENGTLYFIDKPLYYRRENLKGVSQGAEKKIAYINNVLVMLHAYNRRKSSKILNLSKKEMSNRLLKVIPDCLYNRKIYIAFKFIIIGIMIYPFNFIIYFKKAFKIFFKKYERNNNSNLHI